MLRQVFEAELDYEVSKARKKRQDRLTSFHQQQQQLKQEQGEAEQVSRVMLAFASVDPLVRHITYICHLTRPARGFSVLRS